MHHAKDCKNMHGSASFLDEFLHVHGTAGLSKLGVDAVGLDYPQGPCHGFTNRVLPLCQHDDINMFACEWCV